MILQIARCTSGKPHSRVFALGHAAALPGRSYRHYERAATQPSIRPGTRSRTTWAQLSPLRARSHITGYSPWDAQPYRLGATITATSTQPHNRVFTLGRAAMQPSIRPGTRNRTAWAQPIHPRRSAKINPARLLRAGYPAMK